MTSQSPPSDATDDDLAQACAAGDSAAFETLFRRYHHDTLRYICRIRWRTDACREPDDLNQRAWMTILAKLRARVYDAGNFKAWIMTIARNTVLHRPRPSAATIDADPVAPGVTVLDSLLLDERRAKVNECVDKLGDELRSVVRRRMADWSYEEIAVEQDQKLNTLHTRHRRALLLVKDCLQQYGEAD